MFDGLFGKKAGRTPTELLEAQHQCVVFNLIDHESVVAANLYKASTPLANVTLVDIRDPIMPADSYLWLGVGSRDQLVAFYEKSIPHSQLVEIMDSSVFIERPSLMKKLSDLVCERNGGIEKAPLLAKWTISSDLFHSNTKEAERIVRYYEVLKLCHEAHVRGGDAAEEIAIVSSETDEAAVKAFKLDQKEINKGLGRKIRFITYPIKDKGTLPFHQFSTMDNVAYSIIRRCMSAGKNYLHQSMGVYGQIVYSNKRFDAATFNHGSGSVLFLQGE